MELTPRSAETRAAIVDDLDNDRRGDALVLVDSVLADLDTFEARAARFAQLLGNVAAEQDDARLAVTRARAIHVPSTDHGTGFDPYCVGCWEAGGQDGAPSWPCPTVVALGVIT